MENQDDWTPEELFDRIEARQAVNDAGAGLPGTVIFLLFFFYFFFYIFFRFFTGHDNRSPLFCLMFDPL